MGGSILRLVRSLLPIASILLIRTPVTAAVLDFAIQPPTSGTIKYAMAGGPLEGMGIEVDSVSVMNGGGPTGTCIGCTLNFTTGNFTGSTNTTWNFAAGGTVTLIGGIDFDNDSMAGDDANEPGLGSLLLSGSLGSYTVVAIGSTFRRGGPLLVDVKDPKLLAFYGLPNVPYKGSFDLGFIAAAQPPDTFTSTAVLSGDIINHPIPEPSTLLLVGSSLAGFFYRARRSRRRKPGSAGILPASGVWTLCP